MISDMLYTMSLYNNTELEMGHVKRKGIHLFHIQSSAILILCLVGKCCNQLSKPQELLFFLLTCSTACVFVCVFG